MFKWLGQRREAKKQKSKQLWGRDFNIVENRLDEKQVVSFVDELMKQPKASPSASVRSVLKTAVADAEQIVASIKMKAQAEAEEEAARIITKANEAAKTMKRESETAAEKEAEDVLSVANRKTETTEVKTEPKASPKAREKVEEPVQPREEPVQPLEEPVQPREEATVSEPVAAATEELLEPPLPEERPDRKETKLGLLKQDSQSLYTGEVELAISVPVDPKMVSKLYNYLQMTPEIKLVHTSGSWDRGTTITVALDKPIPLISVLSSKIPEAEVTSERPEKDGFVKGKRGVRRIKLALKEV